MKIKFLYLFLNRLFNNFKSWGRFLNRPVPSLLCASPSGLFTVPAVPDNDVMMRVTSPQLGAWPAVSVGVAYKYESGFRSTRTNERTYQSKSNGHLSPKQRSLSTDSLLESFKSVLLLLSRCSSHLWDFLCLIHSRGESIRERNGTERCFIDCHRYSLSFLDVFFTLEGVN